MRGFTYILLTAAVLGIFAGLAIAQELADQQILRIGHPYSEIGTLDPARGAGADSLVPTAEIYNGLVRFAPGKGTYEDIEPDLAESWDVSDDGMIWTFYLKHGVKFHKGYGELTSEDVKFSYERLKDPTVASPWRGMWEFVDRIETPDAYTVKFILAKPYPWLLSFVANYRGGLVVCKKALEEMGLEKFQFNPIGTGPFQFESYTPQDKLVLTRFDDYFRGKPILEKVIYYLIPDVNTRAMALQNGEIDMVRGPEEKTWIEQRIAEGFIVDIPVVQLMNLYINLTREPYNDIRVREAIAYAINRDEILEFYGPSAIISYAPIPPHFFGALKAEEIPEFLKYPYNPEKARRLLAEAGYPNGFSDTIYMTESPKHLHIMTIIQDQLRRVGIDIKFTIVEHSTYHKKIREDANSLVEYAGSYTPLADEYLMRFFSSASIVGKPTAITNFSHYGDVVGSVDELIEAARGTIDPEEQKVFYALAQFKILCDLPAIPLAVRGATLVRQPYVDLGYTMTNTMIRYQYLITEKTRILKH